VADIVKQLVYEVNMILTIFLWCHSLLY